MIHVEAKKFFPLGGPVPREDIVGREELLKTLEVRLLEGQSVMLTSPRRTGKTSVAHEVIRRFRTKGCYTVFADAFKPVTKREFATDIINACLENRTGVKKTTDALKKGIKSLTSSAKLTFRVDDLELDILLQVGNEEEGKLFNYALELPEELGQKDKRQVLVVFDEFQDCGKFDGGDTFKVMRSHFQNHRNATYLFMGSKKGMMEELFSRDREAFFRFATIVPVPSIPEEAWVEYIKYKLGKKRIAAPDQPVQEIVRLSGGHPQDTMHVCSETYYSMLEAEVKTLSAEAVRIGYERAMSSLVPVFDAVLDDIGHNLQVRKVLKKIAKASAVYSGETRPAEVKRAVDTLLANAIIEKVARGTYRFTEPMFKDYILRYG